MVRVPADYPGRSSERELSFDRGRRSSSSDAGCDGRGADAMAPGALATSCIDPHADGAATAVPALASTPERRAGMRLTTPDVRAAGCAWTRTGRGAAARLRERGTAAALGDPFAAGSVRMRPGRRGWARGASLFGSTTVAVTGGAPADGCSDAVATRDVTAGASAGASGTASVRGTSAAIVEARRVRSAFATCGAGAAGSFRVTGATTAAVVVVAASTTGAAASARLAVLATAGAVEPGDGISARAGAANASASPANSTAAPASCV
jgi:hypothetical protein